MSNGGGRNCEQTSQKGPWQDPRPTEETTFLERKGAESSPVLGQHILALQNPGLDIKFEE